MIGDTRRAFLRKGLLGLGALAAPWVGFAPRAHAHRVKALRAPALDAPQYLRLLDELQFEHGFERAAIESLFGEARLRPEIGGLFQHPPERLPMERYYHRMITPQIATRGATYLQERRGLFESIEGRYGVDAAVITAILGVETKYGRRPDGGYRVFDALNTVFSSVPRREAFARRELIDFLLLCRDEHWNPLEIKGSYAGAMGAPQFVPSSYRNYAVDHDGDGRRDLWRSDGDITASVANFLNAHGWRSGEPVRLYVDVDSQDDRIRRLLDQGLDGRVPLSRLRDFGGGWRVEPHASALDQEVSLFVYGWENGRRTVALLPNFHTLLRYNRSVHYALVVAELAELIEP